MIIIENLRKFEALFINVRIKLRNICEEFLKLAVNILQKIDDDTIIKTIFLRIVYPASTSLIKLLFSDKVYYSPILKNDILYTIVDSLWNCEYYWTPNFLNTSSAFKNLISYYGGKDTHINALEERFFMNKMIDDKVYHENEEKVEEIGEKLELTPISAQSFYKNVKGEFITTLENDVDFRNPFFFYKKTLFGRDVRFTNHIFNYFFFEKSPVFKIIFDLLIYIVICVVILINILAISRMRREVSAFPNDVLNFLDGMESLSIGRTPTTTFYKVANNYTKAFALNDSHATILSFQNMGLTSACETVFSNFDKCNVYQGNMDNIWYNGKIFYGLQFYFYLSFLQAIFEMIFIFKIHKKLQISLRFYLECILLSLNIFIHYFYSSSLTGKKLILQEQILENFSFLEKIFAIFICFMWLKLINYLKLIKRFGVIIKIIEEMVRNLVFFFVVFGIIILAFASVCLYLFDLSNPKEFNGFFLTIRSLILIVFGQLDFSNFDDDNLVASLILNIYAVLTFILLLNLLIAILSSTYVQFIDKSSVENSFILYSNYLLKKPEKYFSALISIAPPFNIYLIFGLPLLLWKRSSIFNKKMVMIGFSIYTVIYFVIFAVVNFAVVIPICYFKLIFSTFFNIVIKQRKVEGVLVTIMWIFLGLFYMIFVFFSHDVCLFYKSLYHVCNMKGKK